MLVALMSGAGAEWGETVSDEELKAHALHKLRITFGEVSADRERGGGREGRREGGGGRERQTDRHRQTDRQTDRAVPKSHREKGIEVRAEG